MLKTQTDFFTDVSLPPGSCPSRMTGELSAKQDNCRWESLEEQDPGRSQERLIAHFPRSKKALRQLPHSLRVWKNPGLTEFSM